MNTTFAKALLPLVVLIVGAGCAPTTTIIQPVQPAPIAVAPTPAPVIPAEDPYEGWGTIMPGGVISLRIPPGCMGDPGAGSTYIVCPTPTDDTPTPGMRVSSDGIQVNIRRWEDLEWEHWDKVVASLKVLAPLDRDIQINIQK
jgi:hypothetical protein